MNNFIHAPLLEQLRKYAKREMTSFHVPGHKSNQTNLVNIPEEYRSLLPLDLTEIPGLDDLHDPEGVILEAEQLAADLFQSERTFFLVGGSTVGNLALILSACDPGDWIIVERQVHKSIIHGLMLARANAVFIESECEPLTGLPCGVSKSSLEEALKQYPQAKGVFLTNPNYYGIGQQLRPLIEMAHHYDVPVWVDEAHGAHYGFHSAVPTSAIQFGADAVVQSPHKMLTAMTMSGMLHLQGGRVSESRIAQVLTMIQSSSPSYPMMASIDWSRTLIAEYGEDLFKEGLEAVNHFREIMRDVPFYKINGTELQAPFTQDPFKVLIQDKTSTLNGDDLLKELEREGCMMELHQTNFVLAVFTLASTRNDALKLRDALLNIAERYKLSSKAYDSTSSFNDTSLRSGVLSTANFDFRLTDEIQVMSLDEAIGYRSSCMLTPYPPGIPLLFPGEWITVQKAEELLTLLQAGVKVQGLQQQNPISVEVYKD